MITGLPAKSCINFAGNLDAAYRAGIIAIFFTSCQFYVFARGRKLLYILNITISIMMTNMAARIGAKIEATVTTAAVPVSNIARTGFANPAVVAVDANLPVAPAPFIAVAVPPPAIMAKDQVTTGSKLATVETMTAAPAIAAKGTATLSKRLSNHGMK
jgi:hypothetical protein